MPVLDTTWMQDCVRQPVPGRPRGPKARSFLPRASPLCPFAAPPCTFAAGDVSSLGRSGSSACLWVLDSGSTHHVTPDRSRYTAYQRLRTPLLIEGMCKVAVGVGTVVVSLPVLDGTLQPVTLHDVYHVPIKS